MTSLLSLVGVAFATLYTASAISLPPPTGPFGTILQTAQMIDKHRTDPFSSPHQPRSVMVSIFSPAPLADCDLTSAPYMDAQTASFEDKKFASLGLPPGIFGALELQVCSLKPKAVSRHTAKYPVIIFSPALGTTRLFYSTLAQQIASRGYIVVTVDHPYDVDIVVLPNNATILGVDIPDKALPQALNTRVKDISFVLSQLSRRDFAKDYFPGQPLSCGSNIDTSRVGVIGHSFGGAAAAEAMLFDRRLASGINLDGTFFGKVVEKGLANPFLIFAHEGKDRSTDPSWESIWPKLKGWKRELMLDGAAHYTFSDLPVIAKILGIGTQVEALLGTIDGIRAAEVIVAYVESFFRLFLYKQKTNLFKGNSSQFPEVLFES